MEGILEAGAVSATASEFGPFDGRVWLNTAHQGPLPQPAVRAAGEVPMPYWIRTGPGIRYGAHGDVS